MGQYRYNGWIKYLIGWSLVFATRLLPFRPPNVEPVMATLMPFAKRYGAAGGFVFGFFSIALFDVFVGQAGSWTLITGAAYGLVGVGAHHFFRNRASSPKNYFFYSIVGTIAYDALTGLTTGPLLFNQPFMEALTGQVPFTLWHLLGNTILAVVVSPLIYRWVVANERLETHSIWQRFAAKTA